jgi:hypothetical protein
VTWVRMHPYLSNWPASASPPVFDISSDAAGEVVVELAWDPQALLAPATYSDALRYFTTGFDFQASVSGLDGTQRTLNLPATSIELTNGVIQWCVPEVLWQAYTDEASRVQQGTATTTFACNLYYRVRLLPAGAPQATIWPADAVLAGPDSSAAPRIGILTSSEATGDGDIPAADAVAAAGGPGQSASTWADAISWCWSHLSADDEAHRSLAAMFDHAIFRNAATDTRADLLRLWLLAGPGTRGKLIQLFDLSLPGGSAPALVSTDAREGNSLLHHLLALASVTPHPDLVNVYSKEQLVDDVIAEILDANGQQDQNTGGATSPTCLQAVLLAIRPAEYARLQTGLLSASASATLANGDVLKVPPNAFQVCRTATPTRGNVFVVRTNAELAFQAAVLAYAQTAQFPTIPADPDAANTAFQAAAAAGLTLGQAAAVLTAVLGVPFRAHQVPWPPRPTQADWLQTQAALSASFLEDLAGKSYLPLVLFWTQLPTSADDISHTVLAIRGDNNRVLVANPAYAASQPPSYVVAGGMSEAPPRRYEDPGRRLESIDAADVATWVLGYVAPETALA